MNTIYKYELAFIGEQLIQMKQGAEILSVQVQDNKICLWAEVNNELEDCKRKFLICGTGSKLQWNNKQYIGTVQQGEFVWHIFESYYL